MAARYRAAAAATLVTAELPPFTAAYHRASGITHLLVEPAPQILAALGGEALTGVELRGRLAAMYELDDGALDERLLELVAAGLIEPA